MSDPKAAPSGGPTEPPVVPKPNAAPVASPKRNPAFEMMGLPRIRAKLPSRNWLIFWGIIASWSGAVYYDRSEKKRIQKRWADAVAHLARDPLPSNIQQRKLTIFISAPPADGLLEAREHFHQYVRPILSSAGLDWDAVEGRKEGDVRAELAERIRKRRKIAGESTNEPVPEEDVGVLIDGVRQIQGVKEWDGVAGDIIIGRNTWKEYIRGLHEGWLGPVDTPEHIKNPPPPPTLAAKDEKADTTSESHLDAQNGGKIPVVQGQATAQSSAEPATTLDSEQKSVEETKEPEKPKEDEKTKSKKSKQPPPFMAPSEYASASIPRSIPAELGPSTIVTFPHLLGFLNTPIRVYRYLTKRKLADDIGREVVAACFAAYRPYERTTGPAGESSLAEDTPSPTASPHQEESSFQAGVKDVWEQDSLLKSAELDWHKSVRKDRDAEKESVWLDDMVLDPRIAGRMRRFILDEADVEKGLALKRYAQGW